MSLDFWKCVIPSLLLHDIQRIEFTIFSASTTVDFDFTITCNILLGFRLILVGAKSSNSNSTSKRPLFKVILFFLKHITCLRWQKHLVASPCFHPYIESHPLSTKFWRFTESCEKRRYLTLTSFLHFYQKGMENNILRSESFSLAKI